jgi:4-hydroxymandelate oxidase
MDPLNLQEYEAVAREVLRPMAFDYIAGGADDEATVTANREAFARRHLRYRTLVDVSERDLSTHLLGIDLPHPIILAPTAMHQLAHPEGEAETARGAAAAGALLTLSTISTVSLEDVAAAAPDAPRWFQLYCYGDRSFTELLVKRAYESGYQAIVVTVDVPVLGRRERDLRNSFALPDGMRLANFEQPVPRPEGGSALVQWTTAIQTPALTWEDLGWIRSLAPLPTLIKGIVRADDALRAVEAGIDGIWVSNHGGRQLDGAIPSLDALPEIVDAVGEQCAIIVDGGVRRGTDVLKALALGADGVAIGRPQLYALAVAGADGVRRVVELLRDELSLAMALAGCPSLAEVERDLVR